MDDVKAHPSALRPLAAMVLPVASTLGAQAPLQTTLPRTVPGDLASVRVMGPERHLVFRVYFDSAGESAAMHAIPDLATMYATLAHDVGAEAGRVEWAAVAFVSDPKYLPPRANAETRWSVMVEPSGTMGQRAEKDLHLVLPHEQVHSVQSSLLRQAAGAPRWFMEGQAEWAGLRVTQRLRPALAAAQWQAQAAAVGPEPPNLASWPR